MINTNITFQDTAARLTSLFEKRNAYYAACKTDKGVGHIFTDIIENSKTYASTDEKVLMYMVFYDLQRALYKLHAKNFTFADYYINKTERISEKLESSNSKKAIKGISLPLSAYRYYAKKEYAQAKEDLEKSIVIFEELFDLEVFEAAWAKREQFLNIVRVLINEEKYTEAFELAGKTIHTFVTSANIDNEILSKAEKQYVLTSSEEEVYKDINTMIDAIIFKLNGIKDSSLKQQLLENFLNILLGQDIPDQLSDCIKSYLTDKSELLNTLIAICKHDYLLPKSIEGLMLKAIYLHSKDDEIKRIISSFSKDTLHITFS